MAMAAAVWRAGTPRRTRTGATRAPEVRTAAVDEPVIMPGNMMSSMIPKLREIGALRNFRISQAAMPSSRPILSTDFMKIIAEAMIRIVSR